MPFFLYLFNMMCQADGDIVPGCTVQSVLTFLAQKGDSSQLVTPILHLGKRLGAYAVHLGKAFFSKAGAAILLPQAMAELCSWCQLKKCLTTPCSEL